MHQDALRELLETVHEGKLSPSQALDRLRHLPFEDLGFAKIDHHRSLRLGMPEVIFTRAVSAVGPGTKLVDAAKVQKEFRFTNVEGALVCLWSPGYSST